MVSDAESTTERKRAERLQQNTRLRSRPTAVTHSIGGSIHSSARIKFQGKKEDGEPQKPYRQHGEYHSGERGDSARSQCVLLGVTLACPVCARRGWTGASRPISVCCALRRQRPLLRPCWWTSRVVWDPRRLQPCLCSVRGAESIPAL